MKEEEFPIDEKKLTELESLFNSLGYSNSEKGKRYVYVNFSMVRLQIMWILPKIIYALGVAKELGANVVVITWRKNDVLSKMLSALGIGHINLNSICMKNPVAAIRAFFSTVPFIIFNKKGEDLQRFRMMGLPAGRAIYEDILRTSDLSTIRGTRNRICIRKIFRLCMMCNALDDYVRKHPPVLCVADDIAYHEALQNAIFHKYGAKIYSQHIYGENRVYLDADGRTIRWGKILQKKIFEALKDTSDKCYAETEEMLKNKFEGKAGRELDKGAFSGKHLIGRNELVSKLGIDPNKKNVVIMAHTFSDAVYNYGDLFFRDYYDWLENTLRIASENGQVNWILKPHPTRSAYNEDKDSIEKMFARFQNEHLFLLPDDVSAESIRDIADVIVTIGGNAGGEFACFGIPAVIVGEPYYKGFGYTLEPKNIKEYEKVLKNLYKIKRLSDEKIDIAKKVYYLRFGVDLVEFKFTDDFASILLGQNKKMNDEIAVNLFKNNEGTQKYNDEVMNNILGYFRDHRIEDCEYYQRGTKRGRECH